jgi:hypothetical protein
MTRVLRLTLLAPEIVQAVLDGKQGPEVTLVRLLEPFPTDWQSQRRRRNGPGSVTDLVRNYVSRAPLTFRIMRSHGLG